MRARNGVDSGVGADRLGSGGSGLALCARGRPGRHQPGPYYIDVYRSTSTTLPNPTNVTYLTNVTYQVQLASNLEPGCEVNCTS